MRPCSVFSALAVSFLLTVFGVRSATAEETVPVWTFAVANGPVTRLSVSADESRVAGIIGDSMIVVLDAMTGDILDRVIPDERRRILAVALSPDGSILYSLDVCYPTGEGQECNCMFRRQVVGGAVLDSRIMIEGRTGDAYSHRSIEDIVMRMSPDGRLVAIGVVMSTFGLTSQSTGGDLFLYNSAQDSLYAAPGRGDVKGAVSSLDISADGSHCFFYARWDNLTGRESTGYIGRRDAYYVDYSIGTHTVAESIDVPAYITSTPTLLFSPDDYFLIRDRQIYDYPHMQPLVDVSNVLQWLQTGTHVVVRDEVWGRGTVIRIVNPFTDSEAVMYSMEGRELQSFGMAKGGSLFFTGFTGGSIARWDIPDTIRRPALSAGFRVTDIQVNMLDSVRFVNTSLPLSAGMTCTWEFGDGAVSNKTHPVHVYRQPGTYTVTLHVRNEQGEEADAVRQDYIIVRSVSDDIVWFDKWSEASIRSVAFSADGELVAAATGNRQVMLKRTATGETVNVPPVPGGSVDAVAFPGDGKTLYSISYDYTSRYSDYVVYEIDYFPKWYVHTYNMELKTWTTSATLDLVDLSNGWLIGQKGSLKISTIIGAVPGDSMMYITCRGQTAAYKYEVLSKIIPFNIHNNAAHLWSNGPDGVLGFMNLSPDGSRAVAGNYTGGICVIEPLTGNLLQTLPDAGTYAHFLDDTATVITGSGVWRTDDGTLVRSLSLPDSLLFDIFPQSRAAIVAMPGSDSALAVYSIEKDSIMYLSGAAPSSVVSLAVSPDGRFVATGGDNGHVALWRVPELTTTSTTPAVAGAAVDIHFAPNPVADDLTVTVSTQEAVRVRLTLVDNLGNTVVEQTGYSGKAWRIPVGHLASGAYLCRTETPFGTAVRMVVVRR